MARARTLAALAVVAALSGGIARASGAPVAPRDSDPWWSPRGATVAFARLLPGEESGDVLFTPAVRGREADIIGPGRPRGFRPGGGELLVEQGATTSIRDSADHEIGVVPGIDASWSPDGTRIVFVEGDALEVSAANGADVRILAHGIVLPPSEVYAPAWSPDGMSVTVPTASPSGSALELFPIDGSDPRVVFDGAGQNVDPSWSRDGSLLAFARDESGRWTIWLVAADGTGAREAIAGGANNRFPQWSPTADRLAFLSDRDGVYALFAGAVDAPRKMLASTAPDSPPRWSPDGSGLAVAAVGDCGRFGIYVVDASAPSRAVRRSNQCQIDGTPQDDTIYGTVYHDVIDGLGGNDALFAAGGDDVVDGGAGNDEIGGGAGNDRVLGGPGNDILSGGAGNDVIVGGPGRDKIGCGPGNDTAYIGPGDTVRACEHVHRS